MEAIEKQQEKSALHEGSQENAREAIFRAIILRKLMDEVTDALEEYDYSEEEIARFKHLLRNLSQVSEQRVLGVLAIPSELRQGIFGEFRNELKRGKTIDDLFERLDANAQKYGFTIGYHVSNSLIPRQAQWSIKGSELDDRDNMKMAYYSLDYTNLFRKNRGTYLYIVRAQIGEGTAHKRDLKNNWGRAPELSIIAEFDLVEIEERIKDLIKKLKQGDISDATAMDFHSSSEV